MKFQFKPNVTIVDYDRMINICTFDDNGFYETDNPNKIKYLTTKATRVKVVDEPKDEPKDEPEEKVYTCKKCKFTTTNMGELLAHYRAEHPKKEG